MNRLLAPIFERYDLKRRALQEEFRKNNNRINETILFRLISDDMNLREELGEELIMEYTRKNVSDKELEKRRATVGEGVLWGSEASMSIKKINKYEIRKEGDIYSVKIKCTMGRISAHETSESEPGQEFFAEIAAKITSELEVGDIYYNGKLLPATGWMRVSGLK